MDVQIRSYLDGGAPVLTRDVGSLISVLDLCLVAGYGTLAPLGWAKDFHDTGNHKAIFSRPDPLASAPKLYIQNDLSVAGSIAAAGSKSNSAVARMVDAVIDVDTWTGLGAGDWVMSPNAAAGPQYAETRQWYLIGDSLGFYFMVNAYTTTYDLWCIYHFGDYVSKIPADQYNCWLSYNTASRTVSVNSTYHTSISARSALFANNNDGTLASGGTSGGIRGNPLNTVGTFGGGLGAYPDTVSGDITLAPAYLYLGNGFRGRARGLLEPSTRIDYVANPSLVFTKEYWQGYNEKLMLFPCDDASNRSVAGFQVTGEWQNS